MKSSGGAPVVGGSFREQVATVSAWFDDWNPCEQTVALYSLLKKLGPVQGRFLGLCLSQQGLQSSKETRITEQNANDPAFVRHLEGAEQLVPHLPLLRPGNEAAKRVYLEQIPRALAAAVDSGRAVEQARQLLSYALIHPALGGEERRALGLWLRHLENCLAAPQGSLEAVNNSNNNNNISSNNNNNNNNISSNNHNNNNNNSSINGNTNNGISNNDNNNGLIHNSNGSHYHLLQPHPHHHHIISSSNSSSTNNVHLNNSNVNNSNINNNNNNNNNNNSNNNNNNNNNHGTLVLMNGPADPAMRDVMTWLKTLRLHKYASLLMSMTYEQMLGLTDEQLEAHGVTQGARNKLMLNITKLTQRQARLQALHKDVERGDADLKQVLDEVRAIFVTPMKGYGGVPGQTDGGTAVLRVGVESPPADVTTSGNGAGGVGGGSALGGVGVVSPRAAGAPAPPGPGSTGPVSAAAAAGVDDIPSEMTRLLGKLCSTLLVSPMLEHGGLVPLYVQLLDRCLAHDQFCPTLKRRLYSWKQQMARFGGRRRPFTLPWSGKEGGAILSCSGASSGSAGLLSPTGAATTIGGSVGGNNNNNGAPGGPAGPAIRATNTLPMFGTTSHRASLPQHIQHIMQEPEYEDRLESLCRSMTAHAIGDTTFNA